MDVLGKDCKDCLGVCFACRARLLFFKQPKLASGVVEEEEEEEEEEEFSRYSFAILSCDVVFVLDGDALGLFGGLEIC